jgi:hypothetical protein
LYGCETWSLTLGAEHKLRIFGERALRRIFGPKRGEINESGEYCIKINFIIYTHYEILCE